MAVRTGQAVFPVNIFLEDLSGPAKLTLQSRMTIKTTVLLRGGRSGLSVSECQNER